MFKSVIDSVTRARVFYLIRVKGLSIRKVAEMCRGSVLRIAREDAVRSKNEEHRKRGPSLKLSARQRRQLLRAIVKLREREGNFSCRRIMQEAGLSQREVSLRTISRFLNSQGYYYLQAHKKGLISVDDMKKKNISVHTKDAERALP